MMRAALGVAFGPVNFRIASLCNQTLIAAELGGELEQANE
jgi:hypothetical protein